MGKFSKDKGKRFERQVAEMLRKLGFSKARRTAQYAGKTPDSSDVIGLPGYHIEAKAQERMHLYDWMQQAIRDSEGSGQVPLVIHKQNRKPILASLLLDDFLDLVKKAEPALSEGAFENPQKICWEVRVNADGKVVSVKPEPEALAIQMNQNETVFHAYEYTAERAAKLVMANLQEQMNDK